MDTPSSQITFPHTDAALPELLTFRSGYHVAGAGMPVVMLHSSLASKSQWTALGERLGTRFRVIALDLCGYGDNELPPARSTFTLDDEVRLVIERLDGLVEPREAVHVIGHSYGGLVALRFAQRFRERVASLALYEPVAFCMLDGEDPARVNVTRLGEKVLRLVLMGYRRDAARTFVDFWSGDGTYASLALPVQVSIARRVDKLPLDFRAASSWPLAPTDLRAIVAPTLLLGGTRSPTVVQRIRARLAEALPNCRTASFDAGHMGPVTDAPRVNPWFEAFLDACAERDVAIAGRRATATPAAWAAAAD